MQRLAIAVLTVLVAASPMTWAAGKKPPAKTNGGPSTSRGTPESAKPTLDQQRAADLRAQMMAGEVDKALEGAKNLVAATRDEKAKTLAMGVMADCWRKKSDWRQALAAYVKVRDRCEKASDDNARYDAIAEILRFSPTGVYDPAGAAPRAGTASAAPGPRRTVADDAALEEALARLAGVRAARLKAKVPLISRAKTPQEVMAVFGPAAEEAKQLFQMGQNVPTDAARELAVAANQKLQELVTPITTALRARFERYQPKINQPASLTNRDEGEIQQNQALCKEFSETEKRFQAALALMGGRTDWSDRDRLQKDSDERRAAYDQLAEQFVVPPHSSYGYDWYW